MSTTAIKSNPFTPRSGLEPKVFLGREKEMEAFAKLLNNTKAKRYDHFVVVGSWGTGKTTLLKEFRKTVQTKKVLASLVSVHEFTSGDLLPPIIQLLTYIPRNLPIKFERFKRFTKYLQGVGVTLPVVGGGFEIGEKKRFDGDPQVLLLDGLVQLWQELKEETDALVVFLDDVQHYESVPQVLGVLKNVLSDDDIMKKTGYLFVVAATKEVQEAVYDYTEGHPFQMQILCSYLYENQIGGKVERDQLDAALSQTLEELGPIVLDPLYSQASEQEKSVLQTMSSEYRVYGFDEILKQAEDQPDRISKGTLGPILARLNEKGLLVKLGRGKYRFVNRLFNEYVARQ